MHIPDGRGSTHLTHGDRRGEFVAAVETLLPEVARRLESTAVLIMISAIWGIVLYLALAAFVLQ